MKNPFKNIHFEDTESIINMAFSHASQKAAKTIVKGNRTEIAKEKECVRIETAGSIAAKRLLLVFKSFPNLDKIPEVYLQLLEIYMKKDVLKKILASANWTRKKILELKRIYLKKLKGVTSASQARTLRKEFYGRIASLFKRLKKQGFENLYILLELKKLPDFEETKTIVLAGLPNVGKSSLLYALTGSKPKIREYPFTTQGLMLGYIEHRGKRIQVIDTPGLLDRAIEKRNKIEKKAIVAIKALADIVVYLFDISGITPWKDQENLFREIKKEFSEKEMIVVANKIDIANEELVKKARKYITIFISCKTGEGIEDLKKQLLEKF